MHYGEDIMGVSIRNWFISLIVKNSIDPSTYTVSFVYNGAFISAFKEYLNLKNSKTDIGINKSLINFSY